MNKYQQALEIIGNINLGDNPYTAFEEDKVMAIYDTEFKVLQELVNDYTELTTKVHKHKPQE